MATSGVASISPPETGGAIHPPVSFCEITTSHRANNPGSSRPHSSITSYLLPARTLSLTKYPVLQCIPFRSRPTPMISPHFHRSHTGGVNTEHSLPHPASFWGVKLAPLSPTPSPPSSPGSASSTPRKRCLTAQLLLCSHFSSGLCIIILSQNKPLALRGLNPCSTQTVPKPGPRSPSLPTSSPLGISEGFDCACIPPHRQIHPGTE